MSHFYGTLQGSRGEATRCGTKGSGMVTYAASWDGAIRTVVYVDDKGRNAYRVHRVPWQGSGGESELLAEGILTEELPRKVAKIRRRE